MKIIELSWNIFHGKKSEKALLLTLVVVASAFFGSLLIRLIF